MEAPYNEAPAYFMDSGISMRDRAPVSNSRSRGPTQAPLPAKLTRPRAQSLLPRNRVFRLLDASNEVRCTWITAPAGAGKTSLATSWVESKQYASLWYQVDAGDADPATFFHYLSLFGLRVAGRKRVHLPPLTPEFLPGLDLYARRFFEQLFALYAKSFVVVLDNVHEVPSDAPLSAVVLGALLESLPAHGRLLCLSRQTMPAALVRCSTLPEFQQLGWQDLSLTDAEAVALATPSGPVAAGMAAECNRWVKGWVTGLKLLLRAAPEGLHPSVSPGDIAAQSLFDYYAQEVFERVASDMREFLLRAAVIVEMDADTVAALTEFEDAASVLSRLYDDRMFIERRRLPTGASYQFHPLFRQFLLSKLARSRPSGDLAAMKVRAALSLERRGLLESALPLALECDDPALPTRLILALAPAVVAQWRLATLENWLRAVPEAIRESNGWLLFWLGVASSLRDMALGRASLERAYERFQSAEDRHGTWLAVASIIQNHFMGWGSVPNQVLWQWVEVFEGMRAENAGSIPEQIEPQVLDLLCHFASHCPENQLSRHLVERALVLARRLPDPEHRMTIGGIAVGFLTWRGDEAGAGALLEQLAPSQDGQMPPKVSALTFDVWRGVLLWTRSEHERCNALLAEARTRYLEAGLGFFDVLLATQQALGALSAGDWALAGRVLHESLASLQPFQVALTQGSRALQAMQLSLGGQVAAGAALALELMDTAALTMSPSTAAMERCFLSAALLEAGALAEARRCALQALEWAGQLPSDRWLFDASMLLAAVELERADERATLDHLREALHLAAARDFRGGVSLFQPKRTAKLLALALRHDVEAPYVRRLIRHRSLAAPDDGRSGAFWPVRLRVRTLGQFAIWIDGEPLASEQPATRKPLEVLKALVGLGPTDINLATFGATLWPELDGAAAHNACHVAIHRLRKILRDESAIHITQGLIGLSGTDTWVDVDAFRRLAGTVRSSLKTRASSSELERLVEQLLAAYPGHFLPAEERSWAIGVREQLRARFVHLAMDLAAALERSGAAEAAIALNRHCIDLDPLAENFHRGLMQGLMSLGRKAEALEAFKHCRTLLMAGLGVEPSRETCALQARIRQI